jgi:hypothetical protein
LLARGKAAREVGWGFLVAGGQEERKVPFLLAEWKLQEKLLGEGRGAKRAKKGNGASEEGEFRPYASPKPPKEEMCFARSALKSDFIAISFQFMVAHLIHVSSS